MQQRLPPYQLGPHAYVAPPGGKQGYPLFRLPSPDRHRTPAGLGRYTEDPIACDEVIMSKKRTWTAWHEVVSLRDDLKSGVLSVRTRAGGVCR